MARKCAICNKGTSTGMKISHSHRRSKKTWAPNLQTVKTTLNGKPVTIKVCTRCLRSGKVTRRI
ncbi:MAG TPA: 50S ribosomal protein L28 [Clostridia bacterium]|jgi:large subunit ribosomal protein L28|nr:50S ribosomal protein L28 [Clostridia bacterium]